MSENVQVVARCRPFSQKELDNGYYNCVKIDEKGNSVTIKCEDGSLKEFTYDAAFGESSTQDQVYEKTSINLVKQVMSGYNATIFAYGQTGTGKTYTMLGLNQPPDQRGIVPKVFHQIMDYIHSHAEKKFMVSVSYLGILYLKL